MKSTLLWLLLFFLALLMMVMAVQGSLGRVFAVAFTPASLEVAQ